MEQFSHDLTLALEETSRFAEARNRWGMRRRTRSTGNLPCAPQPTEDSSSSPVDQLDLNTNSPHRNRGNNMIQSDSDDRQTFAFSFRSRQIPMVGNFESDSFNENFSPARPSMRRKRKFKRMAVGYETSISSSSNMTSNSIFPVIVKKRVFNHDNLRANLFFCGKRKRGHRDRFMEYESYKQVSSSVPRQRDSNIISKFEKISHTSERNMRLCFQFSTSTNKRTHIVEEPMDSVENSRKELMCYLGQEIIHSAQASSAPTSMQTLPFIGDSIVTKDSLQTIARKNDGIEEKTQTRATRPKQVSKSQKIKRCREQESTQPQYEERMSCIDMHDQVSSSSLSSSDSETINTNESDHEGDDELTDWPGNESTLQSIAKNDFKRVNKLRIMKPTLSQIQQQDDMFQNEDTLMSTEENVGKIDDFKPNGIALLSHNSNSKFENSFGSSEELSVGNQNSMSSIRSISYQSNSYQLGNERHEVSDEFSNNFLQPQSLYTEIREIRAGCRRVRDERPGFSIMSSANELLSRFLQNEKQQVLTLFNINAAEHEKLNDLSKLYSLTMQVDNGCIILNKTSNTMQSIRVDPINLPKSFGDFKRRCYGEAKDVNFDTCHNGCTE
ncbi:uncharacterized protein LOC129777171 isoform X2 [Toxorhynchites rutilus septentrionalis]|uniref:uncharacterized protein LOC129777171 isoform X2 n=1 Tax=Toxorhynchites rutilus septentrionalis TaxID=329112 RepID=UPI0024798ED1|nr:uncharacterized protein LOC129777171 isoform X2 [Toxorhynchites rutilus septentrionalis]